MIDRNVGCAALKIDHWIAALDHQVADQPVRIHDNALGIVDEAALQRARDLDKDLLLPAMGSVSLPDTFFVVASTDGPGVQIMMKRIREQLPLRLEKRAGVTAEVLATTIPLPAGSAHAAAANPATEALVSQIADSISAMVPTLCEIQMPSEGNNKTACINR